MNTQQAKELLDGLGDTPEQVADSLLAKGITGNPHRAMRCPISLFLKRNGAVWPAATSERITIGMDEEVVMYTPSVISSFITLFDDRKFPALIDPEYDTGV